MEWCSKLQDLIASSTTFAEYIAVHMGLSAIIHWTEFCRLKKVHNNKPTTIFEDNQQCIRWSVTDMINSKNRAVEIKYHRIRHYVKEKWIRMIYTPTEDMVADILTKPLGWMRFSKLRDRLMICDTDESQVDDTDRP